MRFLLGFALAIGACVAVAYVCLVHPADTRKSLSDGVSAAGTFAGKTISSGVAGAVSAINTPAAPPSAPKSDKK